MYNVNCDVETQEHTRQPAAAPAEASLAAGTRASVPHTKRFVSVRCSSLRVLTPAAATTPLLTFRSYFIPDQMVPHPPRTV